MKRTKSKPTRRHAQTPLPKQSQEPEKLPFIAHVYELRKRLFYIAVSIGVFGGLATAIQTQLTSILLRPSHGQQFIYTSPGGGFDFAFRICLYTGLALSIPAIVYNLLRYLSPLVKQQTMHFMSWFSVWSGILALMGILFGYYVGLPAGLHFLLQGFSSKQIQALISIQSYLSFVMAYLLGSALLFQIPLVMLFINKIRPLKPRKLMKFQRWVVLVAFILGAVISPSPDIRNQAILSGPIILMYELSIIMIWFINRKNHKPKKVVALMAKDAEIQAERQAQFAKAREIWQQAARQSQQATSVSAVAAQPMAQPKPAPSAAAPRQRPVQTSPRTNRPSQYVQNFDRQPRRQFVQQVQL